mmetsp:Transcript_76707/g.221685  ORF Transcript_76707/g.221685 Transcript_76707/m.221685 type:complete len:110 (+) Transcript_76707:149-478(+)
MQHHSLLFLNLGRRGKLDGLPTFLLAKDLAILLTHLLLILMKVNFLQTPPVSEMGAIGRGTFLSKSTVHGIREPTYIPFKSWKVVVKKSSRPHYTVAMKCFRTLLSKAR